MKTILNYIKIITLALALSAGISYVAADWQGPPGNPPGCPDGTVGCNPPINTSGSDQRKAGNFRVGSTGSNQIFDFEVGGSSLFESDAAFLGKIRLGTLGQLTPQMPQGLVSQFYGNVGAEKYCDAGGANCYTTSEMAGGGPGGGVTSLSAVPPRGIWINGGFGAEPVSGSVSLSLRNCSNNQILKWISGDWVCATDQTTTGGPSGVSEIVAGTNITLGSNGGTGVVTINANVPAGSGDNLGNHTATRNIKLNGNWLSGDQETAARGIKITNGANSEIIIGNDGSGAPVTINSNLLKVQTGTTAVSNYVLTAADSSGKSEWKPLPTPTCTTVSVDIGPANNASGSASCAAGYVMTGGGLDVTGGTVAFPTDYPSGSSWFGKIQGTNTEGKVYARCCKMP